MKSLLSCAVFILATQAAFAQNAMEADLENEVNSAQGPAEVAPEPTIEQPVAQPATPPKKSIVDEEEERQAKLLRKRQAGVDEVPADRNANRFPTPNPLFKKPPGPKQGGSVRVEHPKAAEGLIRINRDGSYQYKTELKEKSKSSSFRVGMMTPPKVETSNPNITYESMYSDDDIVALNFDYEWQPFRGFGALGIKVGTGFATVSAQGFFKSSSRGNQRSEESYNLFIIPASVFVNYRFEYFRRQWFVPYVLGGGTYYGLVEIRDDGAKPSFAGAPAAGGGGGLLLSISRLDPAGAFTLSQEYGIADMWLVVEAVAMQGLDSSLDFTNQQISAGIAVDF